MKVLSLKAYFCGSTLVLAVMMPTLLSAGAYIFANSTRLNSITHAPGYNGTGGVLNVEVCIDANAVNAQLMVIPAKNIIKKINQLTAVSPNLVYGGSNNIPSGKLDFQSLTLHELGHCTGLGHVNLGNQTGVSGGDTNLTNSTTGVDTVFSLNAGVDTIAGSADDVRGDDENLVWFEVGINNPFLAVPSPDSSNYSRNIADLPGSDNFVANAAKGVGGILGFPNTESIMQQGQGFDEDQRNLQADDVATYQMAMTGIDEIAGTADDYTLNMYFGGIKSNLSGCAIVIQSSTSGFGSCSVGGTILAVNHFVVTTGTFTYNSNRNDWFFNQQLDTSCSVGDINLTFSHITEVNSKVHQACQSIAYGPDYTLNAGAKLVAIAPLVTLAPGTTINGVFTANSAVP